MLDAFGELKLKEVTELLRRIEREKQPILDSYELLLIRQALAFFKDKLSK